MNVMLSLSNTPMAHPPRSNPPLRSSSDAPPFPCITPSTVTCVMVVSFIVRSSLLAGSCRRSIRRTATPISSVAAVGHLFGQDPLGRIELRSQSGVSSMRFEPQHEFLDFGGTRLSEAPFSRDDAKATLLEDAARRDVVRGNA